MFSVIDGRQPIETVAGDIYDIELAPPGIALYKRGNTGLDYVTTSDGGRPGRHVVANTDAYPRFDPSDPAITRFVDEDFNRLWTPEVLDGPRDSVELRRARELRPIFDSADFVLDLQSMQARWVPLSIAEPPSASAATSPRPAPTWPLSRLRLGRLLGKIGRDGR